jgi:hypothetical protein
VALGLNDTERAYPPGHALVGTRLQLAGTAVALAALILELLDKPAKLSRPAHGKRPRRKNPWAQPSRTPAPRVTTGDRRRDQSGPSVAGQADPYAKAVGKYLGHVIAEYRDAAADDWERQRKVDEELRVADRRIVEEQKRLLEEQHAATRTRVRFEMAGLVVVAIGTVISDIGSSVS